MTVESATLLVTAQDPSVLTAIGSVGFLLFGLSVDAIDLAYAEPMFAGRLARCCSTVGAYCGKVSSRYLTFYSDYFR